MNDELELIGLTQNEAQVYRTLLSLGCTTVNTIAIHAKIHRPTTYELIERLTKKGVITTNIRNGKLQCEAVSPEKLLIILKEREHTFQKALPSLKALQKETIKLPRIETFVGKDGMKILFEQILEEANSFYCIASNKHLFQLFKYYLPNFVRRRIKKGIKVKLITDRQPFDKNAPYKIMTGSIKTATWVYEGTVIMVSLDQKTPIGIMIKENNIYETQKLFFETIWESINYTKKD